MKVNLAITRTNERMWKHVLKISHQIHQCEKAIIATFPWPRLWNWLHFPAKTSGQCCVSVNQWMEINVGPCFYYGVVFVVNIGVTRTVPGGELFAFQSRRLHCLHRITSTLAMPPDHGLAWLISLVSIPRNLWLFVISFASRTKLESYSINTCRAVY